MPSSPTFTNSCTMKKHGFKTKGSSLLLLLLGTSTTTSVMAQQSLDVTNKGAVDTAVRQGMKFMNLHYAPDGRGAWTENLLQWHESALYWNTYMGYRKYFADPTYDDFINKEFIESTYGQQGSFLNLADGLEATTRGRWNDDIGWWAMTATEIFGPLAIVDPAGPNPGRTWLDIANNTLYQMLQQNDPACGGGIYWSRNRNGRQSERVYKSTITNVEAIELAARIYAFRPDPALKKVSDDLYAWLRRGLITNEYVIYDGVSATDPTDRTFSCGTINGITWSYHYGPLLSGLATWYNATGDPTYLTEAHNLFDGYSRLFLSPTNGSIIVREQSCNIGRCKSPTGFTWSVLKGLQWLHRTTNDTTRKETIRKAVSGHATEVIVTCRDNWNCMRDNMPTGTEYVLANGTNPRDQIEVMESLIALSVILGNAPTQDLQTGRVTTRTRTEGAVTTKSLGSKVWIGVGSILWCCFLCLGFLNGPSSE
ncbi:glycosyl hydrolase family 76-domain-containing protein [Chytridium lagenaria]|nr:glycosyl hydrolase family 76-domain-containing protein [Chytridium lagenaria]